MHALKPMGLRERKKAATVTAIENAAAGLVTEHGYSAVTVEMICAASDVSLRTFFNYFPGKAAAVGGVGIRLPHAERMGELLNDRAGDILGGLMAVLEESVALFDVATELAESRRALVAGTPELYQLHFAAVDAMETELVAQVLARFAAHPGDRRLAGELTAGEEARLTVMLAITPIRFALHQWIERERHVPRSGALQETIDLMVRLGAR